MDDTFQIVFKVGTTAHVYSARAEKQMHIDQWVSEVMALQNWTGWYMYSDDPPVKTRFTPQGHCKGIVLWNDNVTGWMIHSIPKWPTKVPLEELPEDTKDECHTLSFWFGDAEALNKIEKQVDLMGASVYAGKRSRVFNSSHLAVLQRVKLDTMTDHVAKNPHWDRDLYQSLGRCSVNSRASLDNTTIVRNVQSIYLPGWSAEKDFGRWALGDRWVCVGDVRRGNKEFPFGGGCILRYDDELVEKIRKLIDSETGDDYK